MRLRVTLLATAAVALVLAVTGAVLVGVQRRTLTEQLDEALQRDAAQMIAAVRAPSTAVSEVLVVDPMGDDDAVAQVVAGGGEVIATTPNIAGQPSIAPAPAVAETRTVAPLVAGEGRYRLRSAVVRDERGEDLTVHVGSPLDDIDENVRVLTVALSIVVPVVTALLAAVVFVLVGRTLRPVERIRTEVASIGPHDLDRRVPEPPGGDEIAHLAATMNEMLDRLAAATRRQQRFVADASHELRGPITRMRTEIEIDLRHPETADLRATTRSILDELGQLQRLIDDLLVLARIDADRPVVHHLVDLDDVVLEEVRATAPPSSVRLDARAVSAAQVLGHREQLRRVVRNVLDNAVRHATQTVVVTLRADAGHAVLAIADDGPGIPAEHVETIFERFATLDAARTRGVGGTGLGLAIARDLVWAHHGTISIDPLHSPGARVVITLPLPAAGPAPA